MEFLAAIFAFPACYPQVSDLVTPEDFYCSWFKKMYAAYREVYARDGSVTDSALIARLDELYPKYQMPYGEAETFGEFIPKCKHCSDKDVVLTANGIVRLSMLRQAITVCGKGMMSFYAASIQDANERIMEVANRLRMLSERQKSDDLTSMGDTVKEIIDDTLGGEESNELVVPTGYPHLDAMLLGGMRGANVFVLSGLTGHGKTTTAVNFVVNQAVAKFKVLYVSREMLHKEIGRAFLSRHLKADYHRLTPCPKGHDPQTWNSLTEEQMEGLSDASNPGWPLYLTSTANTVTAIEGILSKARMMGVPFQIAYVDHLHIMTPEGNGKDNRERQIAGIAEGLKNLAAEYKIPIVLLAQLNREAAKAGLPEVHQIRDSGAVENIAQFIMFTFMDEEDRRNSTANNYLWIVRKNRFGGLGMFVATWDKPKWLIKNVIPFQGE